MKVQWRVKESLGGYCLEQDLNLFTQEGWTIVNIFYREDNRYTIVATKVLP